MVCMCVCGYVCVCVGTCVCVCVCGHWYWFIPKTNTLSIRPHGNVLHQCKVAWSLSTFKERTTRKTGNIEFKKNSLVLKSQGRIGKPRNTTTPKWNDRAQWQKSMSSNTRGRIIRIHEGNSKTQQGDHRFCKNVKRWLISQALWIQCGKAKRCMGRSDRWWQCVWKNLAHDFTHTLLRSIGSSVLFSSPSSY